MYLGTVPNDYILVHIQVHSSHVCKQQTNCIIPKQLKIITTLIFHEHSHNKRESEMEKNGKTLLYGRLQMTEKSRFARAQL